MKISWMEISINLIFVIVIILGIVLFGDFLAKNWLAFFIALLFFFVNYGIIILHERGYGLKNFPYKPYKSKKKVRKRILIGLLAGLHYFFIIGSYDHKKYNTQVWYPETLECFFGNISQLIIFIIYILIGINLFNLGWYYSLAFMIIPIATNIISIWRNKNARKKG